MNTFNGEVWQCSVTATDGIDNGPVVSASVTIDVPWAGLITFSNCGQTGRTGPTQSMCDLAYAGEPHSGLVSVTSGFQYWTAPSTATYFIEAIGAGETYGLGAYISGEVSLSAGDVLKIVVGQQGRALGGGGHGEVLWPSDDDTPILVAGGGAGVGDCTIDSVCQCVDIYEWSHRQCWIWRFGW